MEIKQKTVKPNGITIPITARSDEVRIRGKPERGRQTQISNRIIVTDRRPLRLSPKEIDKNVKPRNLVTGFWTFSSLSVSLHVLPGFG